MSTVSVWCAADPLVLASKSAIRKKLLDQAGFSPKIIVPDFDERQFERNYSILPCERAQKLADEKALIVSLAHPDAWVIGADQTLTCEGEVFSKPADAQNAAQQLSRLQGRTHVLKSAVSVVRGGKILFQAAPEARLTMRPLSDEQIATYLTLATPDCLHSVGAYQFEHLGQHLFEKVDGRHSVILGLPLEDLLVFFRSQSCLVF